MKKMTPVNWVISSACLHILPLLNVKQILALHGLLQQGSVLQHQSVDLDEQMAIFLLQVALQLTQQLNITQRAEFCSSQTQHLKISRLGLLSSSTSHWLLSFAQLMSSC